MQISTKGRYALRVLLYLADRYKSEYVPLKTLASEEGISIKYLEHIMSLLLQTGFVISAKGSKGGYKLAETPESFTVGQIVRSMENDIYLVPCLDQQKNPCERYDECTTVDVWRLVQDTIDELMDNLSLLDLLQMQQERSNKPSLYLTYLLHHEKEPANTGS